MGRVNPGEYGSSRPKVEVSDLEDGWAVLTIDGFEETEQDDSETESGKRKAAFLTFEETGEKVLWLNKTSLTSLCHYYGDDPDEWEGQLVPVEETRGTAFNKPYHKVIVVAQDSWHEYLDVPAPAAEAKPKPKRRGTKKKATKRRVKKTVKRRAGKR